jgi:EmrB/QacA subfamily drug resistance transporter
MSLADTIKGNDIGAKAPRKGLILAFMSLSTFLIFLDGTVVNTALPAIARDFSAQNSTLQWVVNMYSLILAGFLLVAATTGDRFGRRKALFVGMIVFGIGAVGAALAESSNMLIAMRGVQGLGAAFALPATLSIITDVFPRGERTKAIAIWTAVGSMGIAIGPALGGYLVDSISWSAVFWLNVPVVALSIIGLSIVPESRDSTHRPLDVPGAVLATGGMLALVYGIIQGGEIGWTSGQIIGAFIGGIALLIAFALVEIKSTHPMLPFHYFKRMDFTGSFLVLLLMFLGMIGVFFFLTQYFQLVQGRSALVAGLAITPAAGMMMIGAGISQMTVPKFGPKFVIIAATLIVMGGMGLFSQVEVDTAFWVPTLGIVFFGLGAGIAMPTVTDAIMASVPVDDAGVGSAMNDLSRELGFTLGVAILGSIVTGIYRSDVIDALRGVVPDATAETISDSVGVVGSITAELPTDVAVAVTDAANTSFVGALNIGFLGAAAFIAMALVVAVFLIPRRMRSTQAGLSDEPEPAPAAIGQEGLVGEPAQS